MMRCSIFSKIFQLSRYSRIKTCSVSLLGTQPRRPELCDNGIAGYRWMFKCRLYDSVSRANSVLQRPKGCMTRSSCRMSSCPFNTNAYALPSLPLRLNFLGRCFELITLNVVSKDNIRIIGLPLWYVPGTAKSRSLDFNKSGET